MARGAADGLLTQGGLYLPPPCSGTLSERDAFYLWKDSGLQSSDASLAVFGGEQRSQPALDDLWEEGKVGALTFQRTVEFILPQSSQCLLLDLFAEQLPRSPIYELGFQIFSSFLPSSASC